MKLFLGILALVVLSFGVYIYADIATQPASVISTTFVEELDTTVPSVVVTRTDKGYEPSELVIPLGATVVWKNESKTFHWPASNPYPVHTDYPEFNPKRALAPGEEWRFTFEKPGSWGFHDHIKSSTGGTVLVEDPNDGAFELEEDQIKEEVQVEQ